MIMFGQHVCDLVKTWHNGHILFTKGVTEVFCDIHPGLAPEQSGPCIVMDAAVSAVFLGANLGRIFREPQYLGR